MTVNYFHRFKCRQKNYLVFILCGVQLELIAVCDQLLTTGSVEESYVVR